MVIKQMILKNNGVIEKQMLIDGSPNGENSSWDLVKTLSENSVGKNHSLLFMIVEQSNKQGGAHHHQSIRYSHLELH